MSKMVVTSGGRQSSSAARRASLDEPFSAKEYLSDFLGEVSIDPASLEEHRADKTLQSQLEALLNEAVAGAGQMAKSAADVALNTLQNIAEETVAASLGFEKKDKEKEKEKKKKKVKKEKGERSPGVGHPMARFTGTLEAFMGYIPQISPHDPVIARACHVFGGALEMATLLPPPLGKDKNQQRNLFAALVLGLNGIVSRIKQLAPGDIVMVPSGWQGSFILVVVQRLASQPQKCLVAVSTSHPSALKYFPVSPCEAFETRMMPLVLPDVPLARVANSTFWFLLYKQLLTPCERPINFIFETLLPYLNDLPLDAIPIKMKEFDVYSVWDQPPVGGDHSGAIACSYALYAVLRFMGKNRDEARWMSMVKLREVMLNAAASTLNDKEIFEFSRSLAWHMVKYIDAFPRAADLASKESEIMTSISLLRHSASDSREGHKFLPPLVDNRIAFRDEDAKFYWFDRVGAAQDVEKLAGKARPPAILIPVPLCELGDSVLDLKELQKEISKVAKCCGLLQNQQGQIPRAQAMTYGVLGHFVCRVVPNDPSWWKRELHGVQEAERMFLLRHFHLLMRHFASAAFSLPGRVLDGSRMIIAAALCMFTDRLCRAVSTDAPSLFASHYSGEVEGPVKPYGLEPGVLAEETATALLLSPDLVDLRSKILEYFQNLSIAEEQLIFKFDESISPPRDSDLRLVEQCALSLGIVVDDVEVDGSQLLTGQNSELLDFCPELGWLRDVAFLSKILLNPSAEKFPSPEKAEKKQKGRLPETFRGADAELTWNFDDRAKQLTVKGFGKSLEGCGGYRGDANLTLGERLKSFLMWKAGRGRCRPSLSDPSNLVDGKERIETEDDVLFIDKLPELRGLGPSDVERLMCLLTAPYIRIPLLLSFFSDREKITSMADLNLQEILDGVLFEPGHWRCKESSRAGEKEEKLMVPATEDKLKTPHGLLFNELIYMPRTILDAVSKLMDSALERDTGRDSSPSALAILYAARLLARTERFASYIRLNFHKMGLASVDEMELDRGIKLVRQKMKAVTVVIRMWCVKAQSEHRLGDACVFHAHLSLLARGGGLPLSLHRASTCLAAQVFLSVNHRWGSEETVGGVYEIELIDTFSEMRRASYDTLKKDSAASSEVMNEIIQIVTLNKSRKEQKWTIVTHLPGVFVPEKECPLESTLKPKTKEPFRAWLMRVTQPLALTVNINIGVFTLRQEQLSLLPPWAAQHPEVPMLVNNEKVYNLHAAEVTCTTNREWLRVVGRDFDVQKWLVEPGPPDLISKRGGKVLSHSVGPDEKRVLDVILNSVPPDILPWELKICAEPRGRDWILVDGKIEDNCYDVVIVEKGQGESAVHVFKIIEHGQRWYRSLLWTSEPALCFGLTYEPPEHDGSVTFLRRFDSRPDNFFWLPEVALKGLLPEVLLERYRFWQCLDEDEPIIAELKYEDPTVTSSRLSLHWTDGKEAVTVMRKFETGVTQLLINTLLVQENTPTHKICNLACRLDDASHALVWGSAGADGVIDEIELPRLDLSFKLDSNGRLMCQQYLGWWLVDSLDFPGGWELSRSLESLLKGFHSNFALVQRSQGRMGVICASNLVADTPRMRRNLDARPGNFLYEVHTSETFCTIPSQEAALHLLLSRWLAGMYSEAVEVTPSIVDGSLQLKDIVSFQYEFFCEDPHADAYALRLRLALATLPFAEEADVSTLPFSLLDDLEKYVVKRGVCDARCVLSLEDELQVMSYVGQSQLGSSRILTNRWLYLLALANKQQEAVVSLIFRGGDGWCAGSDLEGGDGGWSKFVSLSGYSKPEVSEIYGTDALFFIHNTEQSGGFHFILLYELFFGTLNLRILGDDEQWATAACLSRAFTGQLPPSLTHVLRLLSAHPELVSRLPDPPKKKGGLLNMGAALFGHGSTDWVKKLLQEIRRADARLTSYPVPYSAPLKIHCDGSSWPAAPFAEDFDCHSREFQAGTENMSLGDAPLQNMVQTFVKQSPSRPCNVGGVREMLEGILEEKDRLGEGAQQWTQRMKKDLKEAEALAKAESFPSLSGSKEFLRSALENQMKTDLKQAKNSLEELNGVSNAASLRQISGLEASLPLASFVRLMISQKGELTLKKLKPHLKTDPLRVFQKVSEVMFLVTRVQQICRALDAIDSNSTSKLLGELTAKRSFCRTNAGGSLLDIGAGFHFDPRLLAAEFVFGVMLRKSQIELLYKFLRQVDSGKGGDAAMVHQMIMGAGKTTVIAPLLARLLSHSSRLVVSCTPSALLEFSREVLRERYSSPVFSTPVLTLTFARHVDATPSLLRKLTAAQKSRAVVVSTPQSLQSVLLKAAELVHLLLIDKDYRSAKNFGKRFFRNIRRGLGVYSKKASQSENVQLNASSRSFMKRQLEVCGHILQLFRKGVVLLDEVDLILHPLKSEFRWPLGEKKSLELTEPDPKLDKADLTGARWRLAWHAISPLLEFTTDNALLGFSEVKDAREALRNIKTYVKDGVEKSVVALRPHLVLLDHSYYNEKLLKELARWMLVWLRFMSVALSIPENEVLGILQGGPVNPGIVRRLEEWEAKLLFLARQWLVVLLPFVLSKRHRVDFGLLQEDQITKDTPRSRKLLAVPFVGLDKPSASSEFSHPDILIGFSLIAYRLQGLRTKDFQLSLILLKEEMDGEAGKPYVRRKACLRWKEWVKEVGGRVRGFTWGGIPIQDADPSLKDQKPGGSKGDLPELDLLTLDLSTVEDEAITPESSSLLSSVWPLELIDADDKDQVEELWKIVGKCSRSAMAFFLFKFAFPEALSHAPSMLVSSGQELGSSVLFGTRLGFSGTPNDLLPQSMGQCYYEPGCDGQIASTLTDPSVVVKVDTLEKEWVSEDVIKYACRNSQSHALIDGGALVTGLSNREVAEMMLDLLPPENFDAVVYVDGDTDQRLILGRGRAARPEPLSGSGISPIRRFTFYDHVHTTGMDIVQAQGVQAVLTLGKDSTFRDYAQAAFRMRGLGSGPSGLGQSLCLLVPPQIAFLIGKAPSGRSEIMQDLLSVADSHAPVDPHSKKLLSTFSWAALNGFRGEKAQTLLLTKQNVEHLWRAKAWRQLQYKDAQGECLKILKEVVDYSVKLPGEGGIPQELKRKLNSLGGWLSPEEQRRASNLLALIERLSKEGKDLTGVLELSGEQVEEQEQEQEQQQEQEQEQEVQMQVQAEVVPEKTANLSFSRDDLKHQPWPLEDLRRGSDRKYLYPLREFSLYNGMLSAASEPLPDLPSNVMISHNYYRQSWRLTSAKRLKNVFVAVEHIVEGDLGDARGEFVLSSQRVLQFGLEFLELDAAESLSKQETESLAECVGLGRGLDLSGLYDGAVHKGSEIVRSFLLDAMEEAGVCSVDRSRYLTIVTLREAEHIRAHLHKKNSKLPKLCLRAPGLSEISSVAIDLSPKFVSLPPKRLQMPVLAQLARFFDIDSQGFTKAHLVWLSEAMRKIRLEQRKSWFLRVRECRRRPQQAWQQLSVGALFISMEESKIIRLEETVLRIRESLGRRQMTPDELFQASDPEGRNCVYRSDAFSILQAMQVVGTTPADLQRLVREMTVHMAGVKLVTRKSWNSTLKEPSPPGADNVRPPSPKPVTATYAPAEFHFKPQQREAELISVPEGQGMSQRKLASEKKGADHAAWNSLLDM